MREISRLSFRRGGTVCILRKCSWWSQEGWDLPIPPVRLYPSVFLFDPFFLSTSVPLMVVLLLDFVL